MEALDVILTTYLKPEFFKPTKPADRLLRSFIFNEYRLTLAKQISLIWLDIFQLYGFQKTSPKQHPRQINLFHDKIAVQVQNNWKTSNFDSKQSKFKTLKEFKLKHPNYEVIYGCINDFQDRDFYNKDNVRILTGDLFLQYMLGNDWKMIVTYLKQEVGKFIIENLDVSLL